MIIVDKETLQTYSPQQVAEINPHIMFDFSEEGLADSGYAILSMPNQPVFDSRYQVATVGEVVENDGVYSSTWIVSDLQLTKEQRAELIADHRYFIEVGGVEVFGQSIPTDRHTQQVLAVMYIRALADENYSVRFKTSSGFVDLTSAQIIYIADAVHDHVRAAFAREDELLLAIEDGDPITPEYW